MYSFFGPPCILLRIHQKVKTDQSRRLKDERGTEERQVVASVEAVPHCAEEKHSSDATPTLIDDVT